jgi:chaperonin GroES
MRKTMNSGIYPSGNRVVIKPDEVETTTAGGIVIPLTEAEKHQTAQSTGVLVAVGPDAFQEYTTTTYRHIDGSWKPVEMTVTGFSQPFANVGDRVAFAKYGGLSVIGEDGEEYRILNDMDITAQVSDGINFTDIHARKRIGEQ